MANRNWSSGGKIYSMHTMPVLVDCNFVVDSANANGLGIRNLKGPVVKSVQMHSTAPVAGQLINPAAGTILVTLADNYARNLSGFNAFVAPLSGTTTNSVTAGTPAVIASLGSTTPAQWLAAGLPLGMTPAVGAAFIPIVTAAIGGSGLVETSGSAGIDHMETVGDPNATISAIGTPGAGATIVIQTMLNSTKTQPADGTVISLAFYQSNSSVMVQGE
jgi:hypothetical protein